MARGPAERRGHATCGVRGVAPPLAILWALQGLDPFLLLSRPCSCRTGQWGELTLTQAVLWARHCSCCCGFPAHASPGRCRSYPHSEGRKLR